MQHFAIAILSISSADSISLWVECLQKSERAGVKNRATREDAVERERHTFRRSSRCWCWVLYRFLSITGINSTPNEILITMHSDFWLLLMLLLPRVCRIHSASLNCYVLYLGGNQSCTAFINLFNQITFSVSWIVPRCGTRFSVSAFPPILSVLI